MRFVGYTAQTIWIQRRLIAVHCKGSLAGADCEVLALLASCMGSAAQIEKKPRARTFLPSVDRRQALSFAQLQELRFEPTPLREVHSCVCV